MSARLRRAARLIDLASRNEAASRERAAQAERAAATARSQADAAERAWLEDASQPPAGSPDVLDLERADAYRRTLRTRADAEALRAAQASQVAARASSALVVASTERRKLELWRERLEQQEQEEERRAEQRGTDELAARAWRPRA